jgi:hypothetical protein
MSLAIDTKIGRLRLFLVTIETASVDPERPWQVLKKTRLDLKKAA